ncbi:MAG: ABC transporter ATP-binding protein [Helcococcus sp.]|nr:ABC transporter ATP-binding protein [Helcococcus sp.]
MIKLLKKFTAKEFSILFVVYLLVFVQAYFELLIPDFMSEVTRLVQTPGNNINDILTNGLYMLLSAFASLGLAAISGYLIAKFSSKVANKLRYLLFDKIQKLSQEDIDKFTPASLITRTTNDITQVEMFLGFGTYIFIRSPIFAIWAITKIAGTGIEWTIATSVSVILVILVVIILRVLVMPKFQLVQENIDNLNEVTRENITGIRVVRAFNAEKYQQKKTKKVNDELTRLSKFTQKSFAITQPLMMLIMNLLTLSIFLIGAKMISVSILPDKITIFGDMIVFSSYAFQVLMSFLMMAIILVIYNRAAISLGRINEVLDSEVSIIEGNLESDYKTQNITFDNVSFKYPDAQEYVLKDISFSANKGDTIAIIGQTGSGKSTIAKLVTRQYEVSSGAILVDSIDIKEFTEKSLNNKLGYVPQKAVLFNMSVEDNVKFGESHYQENLEDVKSALDVAQAKDFIEAMDDQYNHIIARGGTNVSGGQKQRLAIARAIARKPEIFIFDDTFSALDFKTESTLRKALEENTKNAITILISSRVGSILNADKIILLDSGKVVAKGTHKELWKSNKLYREIALSQLSEEELNAKTR